MGYNMLNPCKINLSRQAFNGDMILVGLDDAYGYENGKRTDVVTAKRASVVLPAYGYERLTVKLPLDTEIDCNLIGKSIDFSDFAAKVYSIDGRIGFSVTATGVHLAKPDKP